MTLLWEKFEMLSQLAELHDRCVLWPYATDREGFGRPISRPGRRRTLHSSMPPHRHLLHDTLGPPLPDERAVCLCGRRSCVNSRHWRWGLQAEISAAGRVVANAKRLHGAGHDIATIAGWLDRPEGLVTAIVSQPRDIARIAS